ncbi:hypothetical protein [Streptomyces sp. NPDC014733]|uniref:hypothetical protein n=1 Tax=Streptomyces sp. NPDC014733 TaxID=3364885 RepID=UPI0036FF826E
MKTTVPTPEQLHRRTRAWSVLSGAAGAPRRPRLDDASPGELGDIAVSYDRVLRRAAGRREPDASDAEVLAALLTIRMLREKLDRDEVELTALARSRRITWAQVAEWQELSGRQAAERRYLQRSQAYLRPDGSAPQTQADRVEAVREQRSRRAERAWALEHRVRIRRVAAQLAALPDLQDRADRSAAAKSLRTLQTYDAKPSAVPVAWPRALRAAVAEEERFRTETETATLTGLDARHHEQRAADLAHRMLGLALHAADPRHLDLDGHPDLLDAITDLQERTHR